MITTYQLELSARLMPSDGYKLYAWLLTQIPSAAAEALHSQQDHPISQFVTFDKEKDTSIWNIHLLSTEASALFAPAIETSLDKGTQRKTTENELPSLTQCTA